ncbi:MAG: hypothetical protein ABIQ01_06370 [Pseudolysinimonas sp.]
MVRQAAPPDPAGPEPATDPALGGPLWVSPPAPRGSAVVVATDALIAQTERLERLHLALGADAVALDRVDGLGVGALAGAQHGPATAASRRSAVQLDAARAAVRSAADVALRTGADLRQAISAYSATEDEQRANAQRLGSLFGILWGPAIRVLLIAGLPAVLLARAAGLGADDMPLDGLKQWLLAHPELITDPAFVEGVRAGVMSIDDTVGSVAGLPPGATAELAAAYGFTGVEAGAALTLVGGRTFGLFRETPVSVVRIATTAGDSAPSGSVERLSRVPEGDQVRIERYDAPGLPPRYVVYVGPTETFSPIAAGEPWDLTSNVAGVAGLEPGSLRATELAMHDAGIRAGDEVQFVGFSQGGLVATRLAADELWNTTGLETYGAPAGGIVLPSGLDGMAIRNSDDFIPALAGPQLDHHLLQVERRAFAPGSPIPTAEPAPAHQREAYVATATAVDAATSDAVRQQIAAMDGFTSGYADRAGSSITVMTYHAERSGVKTLAPT